MPEHGAIALALLLTLLQAFDGVITYRILGRASGSELNPLLKWGIDRYGTKPTLVVTKVFASALCWLLAFLPYAALTLFLIGAFYSAVSYHNWKVYRGQAK